MADPSQLTQFAFATGVVQGQRAEVLDPMTGFLTLENGRWAVQGAFSKRFGFSAQTLSRLDATTRSSGAALFAHKSLVCVVNDGTLDAYSDAASVNVSGSRVSEVAHQHIDIPALGLSGDVHGVVNVGSYRIVAWLVAGSAGANLNAYAAVLDATDGTVLRPPEAVGSGATTINTVHLATYSTYAVLFIADNTAKTIVTHYLNTSSASTINSGWQSLATAATDNAGSVAVESLSNRVAVAYGNDSAGTSRVTVKTLTIAGVVDSTTVNTSSTTPYPHGGVGISGTIADTLWVAWNEGTSVKVIGLNGSTLSSVLATTSTVVSVGAGSVVMVYVCKSTVTGKGAVLVEGDTPAVWYRAFKTTAGAVANDGALGSAYNTTVFGEPFYKDGRYYAPMASSNTDELTLCDWTPDYTGTAGKLYYLRPVAACAERGLWTYTNRGRCQTVTDSGGTKYVHGHLIKRSGVVSASVLSEFDFASFDRFRPVANGNATALSGGVGGVFDGATVFEQNFIPRPPTPTTSTSGTGITLTNGRRYVAVYERVDAAGNWHQSGVSDPSTSTGAVANKTITVSIKPLAITSHGGVATYSTSLRIAVYATLDSNSNSSPYYRLGTVENSPIAATRTVTDITSDATLSTQALLYGTGSLPGTNGAGQDHRAPPSLRHLVSYNGMLVGANGSTLRWSGQDVDGEGTWWSPLFQTPVPGDGYITAVAAQDGTLYAFKRKSIYAVTGEPSSDNGAVGGLGSPRRLAVDIGAAQRPTCVTSMGIWFVSDRGIELLTRAQTVEWIGEAVVSTLSSYPYVTSITYDPASSCVLIECASATSSGSVSGTGRTLVYDTLVKAWSIDRRKNNAGTADTPAQDAAVVWNGSAYRYAWLGTDGRAYIEDQTTYLDPGSAWVTMKAETGWVKLAGIQGYQQIDRALLLAAKSTDHDLTVSLGYDYSSSYASSRAYTRSDINALTREQLEVTTGNDARCQAIRIKFEDATPTGGTVGTGAGAAWIALTLEGIVDRSRFRLPAGAR